MPQILNETEHRYLSMSSDFRLRENFELRMLEENRIEGLLRLSVCDDNGLLRLNYDITGMEPLSEFTAARKLKSADIRQLILTLRHVVSGIAPYLLSSSGILLTPETVYISPFSGAPCFLYLPGRKDTFSEALSDFLQTLLACTDHDDCASVVLAYRLYKESLDHPNALDRLEQLLVSPDSAEDPALLSPGPENIELSPANPLTIAAEESLVTELREVPADGYSSAVSENEKSGGLFHRLFRKNEAKNTAAEQSEDAAWLKLMEQS